MAAHDRILQKTEKIKEKTKDKVKLKHEKIPQSPKPQG